MTSIQFEINEMISLRHLLEADIDGWYQEQLKAEASKSPLLSVDDCSFMIKQRQQILRKFDSVA